MARLKPPVKVVTPHDAIPENLRLGPVIEVWAEPEVIAMWLATPPASRTQLRDPQIRAWMNFGAARRAWLDDNGYTLHTMPPGLVSGKPRWARPGELSAGTQASATPETPR